MTEIEMEISTPLSSSTANSITTPPVGNQMVSISSTYEDTLMPATMLDSTTAVTEDGADQTTTPISSTTSSPTITGSPSVSTPATTTPATSEAVDFRTAFMNLFQNPLIPASFMKNSRKNLLCDDKGILSSKSERDNSGVIVEEVPNPEIEDKVREITNTFIETLKYDRSWFVSLLFQIRKEQKRRESSECTEAECIYKIPCYLSQRFLALSMYSEVFKRERVREGFDLLRRRRRSLDGLDITGRYTSVVEDGEAPVTNCTGIFANYCYNSIACIYVNVLESAACSCMPGYTGLRCDLYDLSITLATLSQFSTTTIDIEELEPEDSAKMYSVLDATARYTYSAFTIDDMP
ncbi:unnamed protein product [Rodentolepis nana]|uniref:EGF-like domain-containing protein n=1 Tax=Rodentolepis nana TaxID=102285 RepID=A0A0R3TAD3_RODNA|nr:unnamed protein product [Rodentolepis nana]